jgi:hypothetical protein
VSSAVPFVPMSVESLRRLGSQTLTLLGDLADQAGRPGLSWAAFISGALRELSVALCRCNASLCRLGAYVATRASGQTLVRGLARPSAKVVWACFAPLYVGFFCLAALCEALLCAVRVGLPLVTLPAGRPFLPSLYVKNFYCFSCLLTLWPCPVTGG